MSSFEEKEKIKTQKNRFEQIQKDSAKTLKQEHFNSMTKVGRRLK